MSSNEWLNKETILLLLVLTLLPCLVPSLKIQFHVHIPFDFYGLHTLWLLHIVQSQTNATVDFWFYESICIFYLLGKWQIVSFENHFISEYFVRYELEKNQIDCTRQIKGKWRSVNLMEKQMHFY